MSVPHTGKKDNKATKGFSAHLQEGKQFPRKKGLN